VWNDPAAAFSDFDCLLLRATWDYASKADAFAAWLDRPDIAPRLWNRPDSVRWNLHKGYLLELASRGVPIVPTVLLGAGGGESIAATAAARGWEDLVVKPAVSAGSARTRRFTGGGLADADAFAAPWRAETDAIVQPYLRSVEGGGAGRPERAIVWIDGLVTHVVEKSRRFADDDESVRARGAATGEEIAFAVRTIEASGFDPLYARIDVMDGPGGEMLLSELELIEPSLFFPHGPGSVSRFADAAERRAENAPRA
jgi:glutathione synthase/RimK-type ligase-like ATP-grasp enzyme